MRRITLWFVSTVAVLVLLFSYHTSTSGPAAPPAAHAPADDAPGIVSGPGGSTPAPTPTSGEDDGATPTPGATSAPNTPSTKDTVVNGTVADTRWGPVQVRVRISGGRITDVSTLRLPSGNRTDRDINNYAVPLLRQEVLTAQSANIDTVSGATVTSNGYRESLQAALDAAHFKA
jgi:uncharacterized protein with FMN-binding domain